MFGFCDYAYNSAIIIVWSSEAPSLLLSLIKNSNVGQSVKQNVEDGNFAGFRD